jgi:hypothetical protein
VNRYLAINIERRKNRTAYRLKGLRPLLMPSSFINAIFYFPETVRQIQDKLEEFVQALNKEK